MKLHELRPAPGSHKKKTRVGRGIAAGQGKTAGRGTKGQKARAGGKIPAWFEGGQTPLHQRIPKLQSAIIEGLSAKERANILRVSLLTADEYKKLHPTLLANRSHRTRTPRRSANGR